MLVKSINPARVSFAGGKGPKAKGSSSNKGAQGNQLARAVVVGAPVVAGLMAERERGAKKPSKKRPYPGFIPNTGMPTTPPPYRPTFNTGERIGSRPITFHIQGASSTSDSSTQTPDSDMYCIVTPIQISEKTTALNNPLSKWPDEKKQKLENIHPFVLTTKDNKNTTYVALTPNDLKSLVCPLENATHYVYQPCSIPPSNLVWEGSMLVNPPARANEPNHGPLTIHAITAAEFFEAKMRA